MQTADVLAATPPQLSPERAGDVARAGWGIEVARVELLVSERDQNFLVREPDGRSWVLKVSNAAEDPGVVEMEVAAVERVAAVDPGLPVPLARPTLRGEPIARVELDGAEHLVRLLPVLPGRNADPGELDADAIERIGVTVGRLSRALRGFFHPAAGRVIAWDQQRLPGLFADAALVTDPDRRALLDRVIGRFRAHVVPRLPELRAQVIHNDVTLDNLLVDEEGRVTGIIDFGDMAHTATILDVPATLQSLFRERIDIFEVAGHFLPGFASVVPIEELEAELLGDLLAGRMAQTILISARRTREYPDNAYIAAWSEPAWALLRQLEEVGFDVAGERLAALTRRPASRSAPGGADLLERRRRVLGNALEPLSYRTPLHLVRGEGAWMIDADGRRYVDAYNNVPVLGHAHPRVVEAIARQAALLNTNTRYLHPTVVELAERIVASMPDGLDTVMFVNSGSEANDLAWRLARATTGGTGALVTDWAYHGVTAAIADVSPSEWRDGQQPAHVETFPAPGTYRGPLAGAHPERVARAEVAAAAERLADRDHRPAALFLDSFFTADGIFAPDPATVAALIAAARAAGALYVADEVQSGHGRSGDGLWRFPAWGVVPDIVTLGKPMGNGHPVAAVVTRSEIVDRLASQTAFFSTFGGNPVASAAALTVLEVIEDEGLIGNAAGVGDWLRSELVALAERHAAIGDVRGRGLMIGIELVTDREERSPDGPLASQVKEELRERGVLIGTSGREGNTLKIRPPLCITRDEAALIVSALDEALAAG